VLRKDEGVIACSGERQATTLPLSSQAGDRQLVETGKEKEKGRAGCIYRNKAIKEPIRRAINQAEQAIGGRRANDVRPRQ
jgi:hypothetical protein